MWVVDVRPRAYRVHGLHIDLDMASPQNTRRTGVRVANGEPVAAYLQCCDFSLIRPM